MTILSNDMNKNKSYLREMIKDFIVFASWKTIRLSVDESEKIKYLIDLGFTLPTSYKTDSPLDSSIFTHTLKHHANNQEIYFDQKQLPDTLIQVD